LIKQNKIDAVCGEKKRIKIFNLIELIYYFAWKQQITNYRQAQNMEYKREKGVNMYKNNLITVREIIKSRVDIEKVFNKIKDSCQN
jgi:hypothetical protein